MIDSISLYELQIPLVHPFRTSFGVQKTKSAVIVEICDEDGNTGWGESSVEISPGYCYETTETVWHILERFLIPKAKEIDREKNLQAEKVEEYFKSIRGHEFAKAGIESAIWSLKSERENVSLAKLYGATENKIPAGVSIGIANKVESLLQRISSFLEQGYQRIKIKIEPNWDLQIVKLIRKEFGDILLMVDANSAYSLKEKHIALFQELDQYELLMIEQPLDYQDILAHKKLQAKIETPLCLDESIHTVENAVLAIEEGCCKIINIKPGRVGGYKNAQLIAEKLGAGKVWCGGMLETGIGRLHNVFLQARPEFKIPGDTSGSDRYFKQDVIAPPVTIDEKGFIHLPKDGRLSNHVVKERVLQYAKKHKKFV